MKKYLIKRQRRKPTRGMGKSNNLDKSKQIRPKNGYDEPFERWRPSTNKYYAISTTVGNLPINGDVVALDLPPQGVTSTSRIADAIKLHAIEHNYFVQYTSVEDIARIIVFQTVGATSTVVAPNVTDLLLVASVNSPYIIGGERFYRVLYDKCHSVTNTGANNIVHVKTLLKPMIQDIRFVPGSQTSVYTGQVWLLYLNASGTASINFQSTATHFFTD